MDFIAALGSSFWWDMHGDGTGTALGPYIDGAGMAPGPYIDGAGMAPVLYIDGAATTHGSNLPARKTSVIM